MVPTCSQLPCPMLCPLTGHTYRGTSHFRGLLRCQRSPIFSARCPLAVAQVLFLWFLSVAPWTPQSQPPLLPAQQPPATRPTWLTRPPSLAHLHPLPFWSPRLALAPHSDTTQTPGLLGATWVLRRLRCSLKRGTGTRTGRQHGGARRNHAFNSAHILDQNGCTQDSTHFSVTGRDLSHRTLQRP